MRKRVALSLMVVSSFFSSCNHSNDGFTSIKGIFNEPNTSTVGLMKVESGKKELVSQTILNKSKEYGFNIKSDYEGFYVIGKKDKLELPIYVKGGEEFEIDFDNNKFSFTSAPNKENEIIKNWCELTDTLNYYNEKYDEFVEFYPGLLSKMLEFRATINSGNKKFDSLMKDYVSLRTEEVPLIFLFSNMKPKSSNDEMPKFYSEVFSDSKATKTSILKLPNGIMTLGLHNMYQTLYVDKDVSSFSEISGVMNELPLKVKNDSLRAYLSLEVLPKFKFNNKEYKDFIKPLRPSINKVEEVKIKIDEFEKKLPAFEEGMQGIDFTFKDINDKDVSFSDFRGKVVYIDLWAMWCNPCRAEIPYLKKLEKKFHGKDVVFVSISLDAPNQKDKWKKFVKKEGMTGVQLFATNSFQSKIVQDYKIRTIPRFMLFDKKGNIVNIDAIRPSDPKMEDLLKSLLK